MCTHTQMRKCLSCIRVRTTMYFIGQELALQPLWQKLHSFWQILPAIWRSKPGITLRHKKLRSWGLGCSVDFVSPVSIPNTPHEAPYDADLLSSRSTRDAANARDRIPTFYNAAHATVAVSGLKGPRQGRQGGDLLARLVSRLGPEEPHESSRKASVYVYVYK